MPLKFTPYVSPEAYWAQQEKSRRRPFEERVIDPLLQGATLAMQGQELNVQQARQAKIDQYLADKEAREKIEFEYKYGRAPGDEMLNMGETGQSSFFPDQKFPVGTPASEAVNRYRAEGYPQGSQYAGVQPFIGSMEREKIFERNKPKDISYQKSEYTDAQGRSRIGRWNPSTGRVETTPEDLFSPQTARGETAGNLRKEFIDRPETKEYQNVSTSVKSMDSLLKNALSGNMQNQLALDQALITMYNKLTDPNSVVRESEYARTPENIPIINRISGAIEKVQAGGAGLTNDDRKALVIGAKIIANERGRTYSQTRGGYVDLAKQMSLDPSLITATMPEFSPYSIESQNQESKVINGHTYIKINGEWYEQ